MTHLILVRHGETDWNTQHRFQGQTDVPLNYTGREQAVRLAGRLTHEHIDAVYSSDLERAVETADIVTAHRPIDVRQDSRLRELSFGAFEGLLYSEIKERFPAELAAWERDRSIPPPGGESLAQLVTRVQNALAEITARHASDRVMIVGHGGPLRVLLCLIMGLPPEQQWQFRLEPTSWSEIGLYETGAILSRLNDTCHLHH
jgi:alpha-ribazole phosphatase